MSASYIALWTSNNNGSPPAPGSFVRSKTAIALTDCGIFREMFQLEITDKDGH